MTDDVARGLRDDIVAMVAPLLGADRDTIEGTYSVNGGQIRIHVTAPGTLIRFIVGRGGETSTMLRSIAARYARAAGVTQEGALVVRFDSR